MPRSKSVIGLFREAFQDRLYVLILLLFIITTIPLVVIFSKSGTWIHLGLNALIAAIVLPILIIRSVKGIKNLTSANKKGVRLWHLCLIVVFFFVFLLWYCLFIGRLTMGLSLLWAFVFSGLVFLATTQIFAGYSGKLIPPSKK